MSFSAPFWKKPLGYFILSIAFTASVYCIAILLQHLGNYLDSIS